MAETEDTGKDGAAERRFGSRRTRRAFTAARGALPTDLKDSFEMLDVTDDCFDGCPRVDSRRTAAAVSAAKAVEDRPSQVVLASSHNQLFPLDADAVLLGVAMIGYLICHASEYWILHHPSMYVSQLFHDCCLLEQCGGTGNFVNSSMCVTTVNARATQ